MKDIKRRMGGIRSIMQITNAMELVSSAKLRKARQRLERTRPYYQTVYRNINELLALSNEPTSKFLHRREVKKRAVIVFTSSRGLAGGYNINVVNEALKYAEDTSVETVFYPTGTRGVDLLRRKGCTLNTEFTYFNEEADAEDAQELGNYMLDKFAEHEYDEVIGVYTQFESVLTLTPRSIRLLPTNGFEDQEEVHGQVNFEYEPSPVVVLSQMIRQYVNVIVYGFLLESSASEQASRRTAMENATENGEEIVEELDLLYNRARQASITQEITEIVGGAEALK